ncbi:MAG: hypothetical protein KDA81_15555 [Planctomycetaceae bacterium]|nr:hypothetical protein [Planctomycetaceae bacterium]
MPVFFLCCLSGQETAGAAEFSSVRIGYDGIGKVGRWLPIRVEVSGCDAGAAVQLRAQFPDPRGDRCIEVVDQQQASEGNTILSGFVKIGRLEGQGTVTVVAADNPDQILCRSPILFEEHAGQTIDADASIQTRLYLSRLGVRFLMTAGPVTGFDDLVTNAAFYSANPSKPMLRGLKLPSAAEMPEDIRGYDGIDTVLLVSEFGLSERQVSALQSWVHSGGTLFISGGASVKELLNSGLGKWLAPHFEIAAEPIGIRNLSTLQGFVDGATRLGTLFDNIPMMHLQSRQTSIVVDSLNGPILGTQSIGGGIVTVLALDINEKPLDRWTSLPQFLEVFLLGQKLTRQTAQATRTSRISHSGVSDTATQLMASIDATPEQGNWSTWVVMAFIVLWLMMIGPVDYFLVSHIFKRPHLTWLTFPVMILGGAAVVGAFVGSAGNVQLNQVHILDVMNDSDAHVAVTRSWMSLSTPDTQRADLSAQPASELAKDIQTESDQKTTARLSWLGRPEDVYGGMYRIGGIGLGMQSYVENSDQNGALSGMPLLTGGSRAFTTEWQAVSPKPLSETKLSVSGYGLLNGSFVHSLPAPIHDWIVVHGNRVYRHTNNDSLKPGQVWEAGSPDIYASDLKGFLNGARIVQTDGGKRLVNRGSTQEIIPYDASSDHVDYITTMSSLYDASGGAAYVGLSRTMLARLELSDTIHLNHAVLIGRMDLPATTLLVNGVAAEPTRSQTVVRLFLNVDRRPAKGLALSAEELEKLKEERLDDSGNE